MIPTKAQKCWFLLVWTQKSVLFGKGGEQKNVPWRETGEENLVDGGCVVYMEEYSIVPVSLRAHKSYVFVKQQKSAEEGREYGKKRKRNSK